jgi:hypothetical protein
MSGPHVQALTSSRVGLSDEVIGSLEERRPDIELETDVLRQYCCCCCGGLQHREEGKGRTRCVSPAFGHRDVIVCRRSCALRKAQSRLPPALSDPRGGNRVGKIVVVGVTTAVQ